MILTEFLTFLRSLENDPERLQLKSTAGLETTEKTDNLSSTIASLEKHQAKIDDVTLEFEKLVEKSCEWCI